ncbi:hypothetical protein G6F31_018964 [Rhizopus arrhizus]|nr:hypothetical protein G6F31_018964 [Rhizopus arrhizus]
MAPDDVQHAAVRKQQDAFAVVAAGDVVHGGDHARLELAQRFTAIQWAQGVTAFPGGRGLGGLHVDTVVVQAFQHAKAALADAGLHAYAQAQLFGHGHGGRVGARAASRLA